MLQAVYKEGGKNNQLSTKGKKTLKACNNTCNFNKNRVKPHV